VPLILFRRSQFLWQYETLHVAVRYAHGLYKYITLHVAAGLCGQQWFMMTLMSVLEGM
jgi:hypothetical protein